MRYVILLTTLFSMVVYCGSIQLAKQIDIDFSRALGFKYVDIDSDKNQDLIVIHHKNSKWHLTVSWSFQKNENQKQLNIELSELSEYPHMRDQSNSVIDVVDINGDKVLDVVTSLGVLLSKKTFQYNMKKPKLKHTWYKLVMDGTVGLHVAQYFNQQIWTSNNEGQLQKCRLLGDTSFKCQVYESEYRFNGKVEMARGDFDHDRKEDLLVGTTQYSFGTRISILFSSQDNYAPKKIEGLDSIDWAIGDINGDGFLDIVAQVREMIPDFPSTSQIWLSTKNGFEFHDEFTNYDNHNDNAALSDINKDGCLDYLQIGVDSHSVGVRLSKSADNNKCELKNSSWDTYIPYQVRQKELENGELVTSGSIGVQSVDFDGDGQDELILRFGWTSWDADYAKTSILYLPKIL